MPVTWERASAVLEECLRTVDEGLGLWGVRRPDDPSLVGCVGLARATTAAEYEPELAAAIEPVAASLPAAWGRGYAREALEAVVAYFFASFSAPTLDAVSDVPNERSDRMLRRLGFTVSGEFDGPRHRLRRYTLAREDFRIAPTPGRPPIDRPPRGDAPGEASRRPTCGSGGKSEPRDAVP